MRAPLYQDLQALIEAEAAKPHTHTLLLAVQSGDRRINFRSGVGAPANAPFYIASITKMFTASLVLQLIDQGRIGLDTTAQSILRQYDLSDLHRVKGRSYGPQLTIRQLLHQTSGVADYYEGNVAKGLRQGSDQAYDLTDVLDMTKALPPFAAPDSGRSYYSDTNYQLLGAIIETVTGRSFADVVQAQICGPLGLRQTSVRAPEQPDQPAPLQLYHRSKPLDLPMTLSSMGPDGGIVSTPDDMLRFLRAYRGNALFDSAHHADLYAFNALAFPLQYGFGLMRFKLPRWMNLFRETPLLLGHSGACGSFAFFAPNHDIYLTGTFNQVDAPKRPYALMMRVMHILARHPRPPGDPS